jgi:hypothetical protein
VERKDVSIYKSARVGLKLRRDEHPDYIIKPYRFVCHSEKVRKGRQHLVFELYRTGQDPVAITGCTLKQSRKWISKLEEGLNATCLANQYFGKNLTVDEFSVLYGIISGITS